MLGRHLRRFVPDPVAEADLALFRKVAGIHAPALDATLPRLSTAANHSRLWLAIAALLAIKGGRFGRRAALRGVGVLAVTSAIANLPGKLLTARQRPNIDVVPEARRLARIPESTSFPSGHSASAAAFATGVGLELPKARVPLGLLAGAVAFSRIYTGVHYPGDVAAGVALGVGIALTSRRAWPLADHRPARGSERTGMALPGEDGEGLVIVANAKAGSAIAREPAEVLRRELPAAEIVEVEDADVLQQALTDAAKRALVLGAVGGDGTVSLAATIAREAGVPLLVIPGGTLDHLASDLGLHDIDDAVRAVRDGTVHAIDVAEIAGRPYVNAASIGVYPHLVDAREEREKRIGKWPAVVLGLAKVLGRSDPAEVEIDGETVRLWLLFAGNCRFEAPGVAPTWRRNLRDGLLDVRLLRADRRWARARVLASALTGRLGRSGPYEQRRVREVLIRALDGPLLLAADGEVFDGPEELTIRKQDDPVHVLVPRLDG